MHVGTRIRGARDAAGWSQQRLAAAINQSQTTISSWERGRTEPTREDVSRVAEALGLTPAEIEGTSASAVREIPIVGFVGAGDAAHFYEDGQGPLGTTLAPEYATEYTVAAEIRGPSIGPYFDGWLLLYDDVRSPVTSDLYGELCVVGLLDGRVLVKKIKPSAEGRFHLLSMSEEPIFDVELTWAAKVTGMKPR